MKLLEPVAHSRPDLAAWKSVSKSPDAGETSWLGRWLHERALSATVPALSQPVGVVPWRDYFDDLGMERLGWRAMRRALVFALSGQARQLRPSIDRRWGRGLILYFGADQLGDALMDLAPRSLLSEAGLDMDLLAPPALAQVFQGDPWLGRVSADVHSLRGRDYDFALVLSHKRRSLQLKREHFPNLPWVSLHGVFSGPDFDRAGFAAQRLADLLGATLGPAERDRHARQKLGPVRVACSPHRTQPTQGPVALAIGGWDPLRTCRRWHEVVERLVSRGVRDLVLLGSANGAQHARALEQAFGSTVRIDNWVGQTSLEQTRAVLQRVAVLGCADGGLMHLAATCHTPMVALFCSTIQPAWRLRQPWSARPLVSPTVDVNDIEPVAIADALWTQRQHALQPDTAPAH